MAHPDGNYFLRPERILGAFHVDSSAPPVIASMEIASELIVEKNRELRVNELLQLVDSKQRSNTDRIDAAIGSIWAVDEVKLMMETNVHHVDVSVMVDEDKKDSSGLYYALDYEPPINNFQVANAAGGGGDSISEC
jgi:hypothetical protein